jgi:large subunit ribosomal protein L14e
MKDLKLAVGLVVWSKAGRDAGRKFVVIDIINDEYVLLVDGSLRKLEKPKKKKIKHIELTEIIIYDIKDKLINKKKFTNAEIKKHLEMS